MSEQRKTMWMQSEFLSINWLKIHPIINQQILIEIQQCSQNGQVLRVQSNKTESSSRGVPWLAVPQKYNTFRPKQNKKCLQSKSELLLPKTEIANDKKICSILQSDIKILKNRVCSNATFQINNQRIRKHHKNIHKIPGLERSESRAQMITI